MTTTLVVLAHPEGRSFNGSWANATIKACRAAGDRVLVSDLTAMGFDAVERAAHYPARAETARFDPLKAQEQANTGGTIPKDVAAEIAKVEQADRFVFHFPIWWFAPPAILKGWFDRVLLHGRLHSVDQRFDKGLFQGRKALFCVTTGATEAECAHNGKEGDVQMQLWPSAQTLRYLGMTVLAPQIIFGVHGYFEGSEKADLDARLKTVLDTQADLMAGFDALPALAFNSDGEFDDHGRLRPSAPSHSPFIRHNK
jgi:NAD(P)H dehydrogenase (quinone)